MTWETIEIAGKICRTAAADSPVCVLIQPTGEHEQAHLAEEAGQILQHAPCEALLVSFPIADWDQELSPWHARQAFGEESFGSGAGATLQWILEKLLPALRSQLHLPENIPYILGGYSLAGLFSLWAAYQTDVFAAVAACSPSVWMDDWAEYAALHRPRTPHIYLSLGTKEHKTRNPLLRTVKERITEQEELLRQGGVDTVLEWNAGNHFQENAARTAKGFLWCIKQVEEC